MTLHDLTEQLFAHFPPSVQKDVKTAVRVLAQALNQADAKSCPLELCLQPLPTLYRAVEVFLIAQGKSPHTIRNTKNNLSRLFRLAETQKLFSLLPAKLTKRFRYRDLPSRGTGFTKADGSYLSRRLWPSEVEAEFSAFTKWATDPMVDGRKATWRKRPITILTYQRAFETYFGYLHHELQIKPVQFSHLFDFTLIERFINWHINEKCHRPTQVTHRLVQCIKAMASQYRFNLPLVESLRALRRHMPPNRPSSNKNDAWVPLHEIERVAIALWPSKPPSALRLPQKGSQGTGRIFAVRAGISLMLRLWVYIPYRQRNMREMKMDQNLYKKEGQWRIRFANEELKVASKRGQPNVFDLPFPPTLISTLETYLTTWRPILVRMANAQEVFLNRFGKAFTVLTLAANVEGHIYSFTGRRWHPHMIRTTWATEWILSSGDFMTAAIMLNDRLETVIQNYAHLRDENVAERAYDWVQRRINTH